MKTAVELAQITQRNKWTCSVLAFTSLQKCPHGDKYCMFKYKYIYMYLKYKYEYKYFKTVLEYITSTSTSTKYYISWNESIILSEHPSGMLLPKLVGLQSNSVWPSRRGGFFCIRTSSQSWRRRRRFRIDTVVRCVGAHPPFWPLEPARVKPN